MKALPRFTMCVLAFVVLAGCQHADDHSSIIGFWRNKASDNEYCELLFTPDQAVYYIFRSIDNKVTIARTGRYEVINHQIRMEYPEGIPNLLGGGVKSGEIVENFKVDGVDLFFGNSKFEKIYNIRGK